MHEKLVNRLGGLSLPRKSVVRLTDRPDMTLYVYRGRKTITQQHNNNHSAATYRTDLTSEAPCCNIRVEIVADNLENNICFS